MRARIVLLALLTCAPTSSGAIEPGPYEYRIHHSIHGDIGTHRMSIAEGEDGQLIIEHEADIEVRVMFTPVYAREVALREVWQEDRLVHFESHVDDDGELLEVTAWAEGDALVIDGAEGEVHTPAETAPVQPSLEAAIARGTFFEVETGEVLSANITGRETVTLRRDGQSLAATRYTFAGDRGDQVWFDPEGVWVKWQLDPGGGRVTLTRGDLDE